MLVFWLCFKCKMIILCNFHFRKRSDDDTYNNVTKIHQLKKLLSFACSTTRFPRTRIICFCFQTPSPTLIKIWQPLLPIHLRQKNHKISSIPSVWARQHTMEISVSPSIKKNTALSTHRKARGSEKNCVLSQKLAHQRFTYLLSVTDTNLGTFYCKS